MAACPASRQCTLLHVRSALKTQCAMATPRLCERVSFQVHVMACPLELLWYRSHTIVSTYPEMEHGIQERACAVETSL